MLEKLDPVLSKIKVLAQKDGAQAEVLATAREGLSISSDNRKLGKFSSNLSLAAGVRVIKNGAEGYASTENLNEDAILFAYKEALENAEFNSSQGLCDQDLQLIQPEGSYKTITRPLRTVDVSSVQTKIDQVLQMEEACFRKDPRVISVSYNGYSETAASVRVFNSHGVDQTFRDYNVSAYAYPLLKEGHEARQAYEMTVSRDPLAVDMIDIAEKATTRAAAKLGSIQPETGLYPVLFERDPAAELIDLLISYFSGRAVFEKRSFLEGKIGQTIASSVLTIIDDPLLEEGLASQPFDSEGSPTQKTILVENGVMKSYLLNSIYARKLGMKNTAHASRSPMSGLGISATNLVVQPGKLTREQLLASHPKVILIDDLAGLHAGFEEGSGDFSLQASGELWQNGQRVAPLCDFVVSGNLRQMLAQIEAVACRPTDGSFKINSSIVTPELLVSQLSIAGKSK